MDRSGRIRSESRIQWDKRSVLVGRDRRMRLRHARASRRVSSSSVNSRGQWLQGRGKIRFRCHRKAFSRPERLSQKSVLHGPSHVTPRICLRYDRIDDRQWFRLKMRNLLNLLCLEIINTLVINTWGLYFHSVMDEILQTRAIPRVKRNLVLA